MGYTQDTHMSQFIPVSAFQIAGTCVLTHSVASNLVKSARTANDTAFSLFIPIPVPSNDSALKGCPAEIHRRVVPGWHRRLDQLCRPGLAKDHPQSRRQRTDYRRSCATTYTPR